MQATQPFVAYLSLAASTSSTSAPACLAPSAAQFAKAAVLPFARGLPVTIMIRFAIFMSPLWFPDNIAAELPLQTMDNPTSAAW